MTTRAEDLLPVKYFHVLFTFPAENAQITYWNKTTVYDLLFRATAETVMTISAADPKRLMVPAGSPAVPGFSCMCKSGCGSFAGCSSTGCRCDPRRNTFRKAVIWNRLISRLKSPEAVDACTRSPGKQQKPWFRIGRRLHPQKRPAFFTRRDINRGLQTRR